MLVPTWGMLLAERGIFLRKNYIDSVANLRHFKTVQRLTCDVIGEWPSLTWLNQT